MARRKKKTGLLKDEGGATYVEFLLAFIPLFFMFLGMMQAALLYSANLVVNHAATTAARSAVVVLPDDPEKYDNEPINVIDYTGSSGNDAAGALLSGFGLGGTSPPAAGTSGSARLQAIRSAASIPLLAVAPNTEALVGDAEVYKAIGGQPGERAAVGALLYNRTALSVTFPESPGSNRFRNRFGPNDDVNVRVTYLFHCGIPLAAQLLCDNYLELRSRVPAGAIRELSNARTQQEITGAVERLRHTQDRLNASQEGLDELAYAQTPFLGFLFSLTGSRFSLLRAEAQMRNQGAPYRYQ
ncbi:MAG: TadE family protein [Myxococcota bacterium]